ncbi:flagellar export chaperone FlgN [Clostridium sp. AL.422]|uniref:flagellar export chaperone FlgN n=1 Tax=Clostridium TaxID=1485 RepID=UPI00293DD20E|nr:MULTISPECIES: flagellar export chaperone FlgN [unclassified Clostridium]MDV4149727.1 flagellar export chaperone FlgN [Clostridium sp. AL.422]
MSDKLKDVLIFEEEKLKELLSLLDKQHKLILNKDIFGMESVAEEIRVKNKEVAEAEVDRRRYLGNTSIRDYITNSNNNDLDNIYRRIQKLLNEMIIQKDTNELLIKQQLSFTNKLLNLINPKKDVTTYNSYGNIRR